MHADCSDDMYGNNSDVTTLEFYKIHILYRSVMCMHEYKCIMYKYIYIKF